MQSLIFDGNCVDIMSLILAYYPIGPFSQTGHDNIFALVNLKKLTEQPIKGRLTLFRIPPPGASGMVTEVTGGMSLRRHVTGLTPEAVRRVRFDINSAHNCGGMRPWLRHPLPILRISFAFVVNGGIELRGAQCNRMPVPLLRKRERKRKREPERKGERK